METSGLRGYLNGAFYELFSDEDSARMLVTKVVAANSKNGRVSGGNDTDDRIFLLSADEIQRYFDTDEKRLAQSRFGEIEAWWTRTPTNSASGKNPVFVSERGRFTESGTAGNGGIRPAMWIRIAP